jgi:hypothetical protein
MLEFSPQARRALTVAPDALTLQLAAHVPLYRDAAGTWRVLLHPLLDTLELDPLLESTVLLLLHPQAYTLASGTTTLAVPLGEALALLPFSRHFPDALVHVGRIEALRTGAAESAEAVKGASAGPKPRAGRRRVVRPRRVAGTVTGRTSRDNHHDAGFLHAPVQQAQGIKLLFQVAHIDDGLHGDPCASPERFAALPPSNTRTSGSIRAGIYGSA